MPQWKQYSGTWPLQTQMQAIADGTWTGIPQYNLYSWGYNNAGQLGQNNRVDLSSPVQVGSLQNWSSISAGYSGDTIALKTDGTLWTWGQNNLGQLGQGNVIYRSSPVQVGALTNWSKITIGNKFAGAIKSDGTMWAWGSNNSGRLGVGDVVYRSSPTQIGSDTNWSSLSFGSFTSAAIKTNGTLWVWGYNLYGGLAQNDTVSRSSPIQVGALTTWASVSVGGGQMLMVKTDGTLWSVGRNGDGQLGQNDIVARSSPVQVGALTNWSKISSVDDYTMSIKTDGTMWSWGNDNSGKLGLNTNGVKQSSPVQIGALTTWSQVIAVGNSGLALKTDGTLWTWGSAGLGTLGTNSTVYRSSPVQVGSLTTWSGIGGGYYNCYGILTTTT